LRNIIFKLPLGIVLLKTRKVTNPPNVISSPVFVDVSRIKRLSGDLLAYLDGFQHGTVAESAAAHVIDLAATRFFKKLVENPNQIRTVNVVADLFFLVSENRIRRAGYCTFHQIGKESV
jgi:hypothetical protein